MRVARINTVPALEVQSYLPDESRQIAESLQEQERIVFGNCAEFCTRMDTLRGASPVDFDPAALATLPRESYENGAAVLTHLYERRDYNRLFQRDRSAEIERATGVLEDTRTAVHKKLLKAGYVDGPPGDPGTVIPGMIARHPDVLAALAYVNEVRESTIDHQTIMEEIERLEKELERMRTPVYG